MNPDVLIVGAGAAGLGAAQTLRACGRTSLVLEARDRVGGRIWTETIGGVPVDLGAAWIHGYERNPLRPLAEAARLRLVRSDTPDLGAPYRLYAADGREWSRAERDALEHVFADVQSRLEMTAAEWRATGQHNRSLGDALAHASMPDEWRVAVGYKLLSEVVHEYADDLEALSATAFDDDPTATLFGPHDMLPVGTGYAPLLSQMTSGIEIRLNQVATAVSVETESVTVTLASGEQLAAPRCIVALPLGVLQAGLIAFAPELPDAQRNALARLGAGVLDKLVLVFPRVQWPLDVDWFGLLTPETERWCQWVNLARHCDAPILIGELAGTFARRAETWSDETIVGSALSAVRRMFGADLPEPVAVRRTRWLQDPFARGSYAHLPPGARASDRDLVAAPHRERLFFAGEHTYRHCPTNVHGAWLSGVRAATHCLG